MWKKASPGLGLTRSKVSRETVWDVSEGLEVCEVGWMGRALGPDPEGEDQPLDSIKQLLMGSFDFILKRWSHRQIFLFCFVCSCVCTFCIFMCAGCACMIVIMYVKARGQPQVSFFTKCCPPCFSEAESSTDQKLTKDPRWMSREPQGSASFTSPVLRLEAGPTINNFFIFNLFVLRNK